MLRRLLGLLLFALCAYAQLPPAVWPGGIATQFNVGLGTDFASGTLSSSIASTDLTIPVTMDSGSALFQAGNILTLDSSEKVLICSATSTSVTVCSGDRGLDGTRPAAHLATAVIECDVNASYFNRLAAEVLAIESNFGSLSGGSAAFSAITSGTNTSAAMLCGSGCSVGTSGAGTIQATSLNGTGEFYVLGANGAQPTLVTGQTGCWYSSLDSALRCKDFAGDTWAMVSYTPPASSSATCTPPQIAVDTAGGYFDVCVATNTWKRAALASF